MPLGYKGEHALDQIGGVRPYSNEALDTGLQMLMDLHFDRASLFFNGGFFRSGNPDVLPQLAYGLGVEFGRRNRWLSFNMEYQARIAIADQSRAAGVFKLGTRIHLFRGVDLELNREFGFYDHPTSAATTFGIRTHGNFSPRRFESRAALYEPPPKPRRVYDPEHGLRLAILDFEGFEDFAAGRRLVEEIHKELAPHDSIEVVDIRKYSGVPHSGTLSTAEAAAVGRALGVDVVVSGQVFDYHVDRFAGLKVPYVFELPETSVEVALRYRIMWFTGPERVEMESLTEEISGRGLIRKRVRLLSTDARDITVRRSAKELNEVQNAALSNLVGNMLASMAAQFSWVPPDFGYENN